MGDNIQKKLQCIAMMITMCVREYVERKINN